MFNFFFIKKHKKRIENYVWQLVWLKNEKTDTDSSIRFSLKENSTNDNYDEKLVSEELEKCLEEQKIVNLFIDAKNLTFVEKLLLHIQQKNLTEPAVYKAAQIDRRLFSKIISNKNYQPSKDTAIALAFALKLSLDDVNDMLARAGYTLSHSLQRDIILEYFIKNKIYNLDKINAFLYDAGEKIIGRSF